MNDGAQLLHHFQQADAILVGAGSGMSAAAGHTHYYERSQDFVEWFGDFEQKYGFHNSFNGFYHPYRSREEYWAFTARMIQLVLSGKAGQPYEDLAKLLAGKTWHILTTNQDTLFTQIAPEEKISAIQGDWRYLQCKNRCHDHIYPSGEVTARMVAATKDCCIPTELLPRCPKCGGPMEPWVRGYDFLEGQKYREEYDKVNKFLAAHQNEKLLFLELGVGRMTPMFIQQPFWNLTYQLPNAFYITVNPKDALLPRQLEQKGLAIKRDIGAVLREAVVEMEGAYEK